jgi:hypothetical protein
MQQKRCRRGRGLHGGAVQVASEGLFSGRKAIEKGMQMCFSGGISPTISPRAIG